jgi:hypothetical protein
VNLAKRLTPFASLLAALVLAPATAVHSAGPAVTLATPESFAGIGDTAARSAALFTEAGKVLMAPRCVNCHPVGDRPLQSEAGRLHQPPVERGADGFGAATMRCATCHQGANFDPAGVPGHPHWHLAPREMAWQDKTVGEICAQIKDPARNGGRSLEQILTHMAGDTLVGWAWARVRPRAGSRFTKRAGRTHRGLDQHRRGVSEVARPAHLSAPLRRPVFISAQPP